MRERQCVWGGESVKERECGRERVGKIERMGGRESVWGRECVEERVCWGESTER